MLPFLTALVMVIVAFVYWKEGAFTAFCRLVSVLIAGAVTFQFFEPLASVLQPSFRGTFLAGYEDFLVMIAIFSLTLLILRVTVDNMADAWMEYPPLVHQFGGAALGLLVGYLVSGFLIVSMETLPWHENFLGFQPRKSGESFFRSYMPPDRVWLSMMRYAGSHSLAGNARQKASENRLDQFDTFDREGTFELRYNRYRRYNEERDTLPYQGEFDLETSRR